VKNGVTPIAGFFMNWNASVWLGLQALAERYGHPVLKQPVVIGKYLSPAAFAASASFFSSAPLAIVTSRIPISPSP
jgi:hypothetical protein